LNRSQFQPIAYRAFLGEHEEFSSYDNLIQVLIQLPCIMSAIASMATGGASIDMVIIMHPHLIQVLIHETR
jgi:hypothetical protein